MVYTGVAHDAVWRNAFCRHLSLVRNAFAGFPTLLKEFISPEEISKANATSDILCVLVLQFFDRR